MTDFLNDFFPNWHVRQFPLDEQVKHFDRIFMHQNRRFLRGESLEYFDERLMLDWGDYFAKQPKFVANNKKNFDLQYDILIVETARDYSSPLPPTVGGLNRTWPIVLMMPPNADDRHIAWMRTDEYRWKRSAQTCR